MRNFDRRLNELEKGRQRQNWAPPWHWPRARTLKAWQVGIEIDAELDRMGLDGGEMDDPQALRWTLLEERYAAAGLDEDADQIGAYRQGRWDNANQTKGDR